MTTSVSHVTALKNKPRPWMVGPGATGYAVLDIRNGRQASLLGSNGRGCFRYREDADELAAFLNDDNEKRRERAAA